MSVDVCTAALLISVLSACTPESADVWTRHTIDDEYRGADGFDLEDVDRDGDLDAVVGWEESGLVIVYEHPGAAHVEQPWAKVDVRGGLDLQHVEDVRFADLDADGRADAVLSATEIHGFKIGIHWLDTADSWLSATAWHGSWIDPLENLGYLRVATGQVDGIEGDDIVAGTKQKTVDGVSYVGKLVWFPSPGSPGCQTGDSWQSRPIAEIGWINNFQLIDLDADLDMDLLMSDREEGLRWFENRLSAGDGWAEHEIGPNHGEFAVCHDVVEPDDTGIVAFLGEHPVFYSRNPSGRWRRHDIVTANGMPDGQQILGIKGIACGDLDSNGTSDIAISITGKGHGVIAYVRDGEAWRIVPIAGTDRNNFFSGIKHDTLSLSDLDADGDLDVITTEENGGLLGNGLGVIWFENPTNTAAR